MHRFYLPPDQCKDDTLALSERDNHHAVHVLRLRDGERVVVLDGAGQELMCEARKQGRDNFTLNVAQRSHVPPLPCQITLLQAIPKGKIIESIIQKATELGVHRIVPVLSERVTPQVDDESATAKSAKWQLTAI